MTEKTFRSKWVKIKHLTVVIIYLVIIVEKIFRQCVMFSMSKQGPRGNQSFYFDNQKLTVMSDIHVRIVNGLFIVGHAIANFFGGILADLHGGRYAISLALLAVSIIALVLPFLLVHTPWYVVAISYFTIGWMEGLTVPAKYSILARWIPNNEMTVIIGSVEACSFVGRIIIVYLVHYILPKAEKFWTNMFQMWGGFGVMLSVFSLIFVHSSPWQCKMASQQEKNDMESVGPKRPRRINWKKIIQDEAVWGVAVEYIGHMWLYYVLSSELEKLQKSLENTREFPWHISIILWIITINIVLSCFIVNKLINHKKIPTIYLRSICNIVGDLLACIPIVLMNHVEAGAQIKQILRGSAFFFKSIHYAGGQVNVLDLTRYYAGTIIGFQNTVAGIIGALIAVLSEVLGKSSVQDLTGWSEMYDLTLGVSFVTILIYLIWARAEKADWDVVLEDDEDDEFMDEVD